MFPWMMPSAVPAQAGMGGNLSLLQMMTAPPYGGAFLFGRRDPRANPIDDDRSDQTSRGNQPDTGNTMAPPGQTPPGGPDQNSTMSGYDYNTVSPGWGAPSWMQTLARGQRSRDPRAGTLMGLLGLSMLQARQPNTPRPDPWI